MGSRALEPWAQAQHTRRLFPGPGHVLGSGRFRPLGGGFSRVAGLWPSTHIPNLCIVDFEFSDSWWFLDFGILWFTYYVFLDGWNASLRSRVTSIGGECVLETRMPKRREVCKCSPIIYEDYGRFDRDMPPSKQALTSFWKFTSRRFYSLLSKPSTIKQIRNQEFEKPTTPPIRHTHNNYAFNNNQSATPIILTSNNPIIHNSINPHIQQ